MLLKINCLHKNKIATDSYNHDMEIYWECPDCNLGWRQEPITEEEVKMAEYISDKYDEMDKKILEL